MAKTIIVCLLVVVFLMGVAGRSFVLRAVRGRDARLPCGTTELSIDGPPAYVLWLKDDHKVIFRYPNEDSDTRAGNENAISSEDFSLLLRHVDDQQRGIYRCRVLYESSAAVDYVIDLQLVETLAAPVILDGEGKLVNKSKIGPLNLGEDLTLVCQVVTDDPLTTIYWLRNDVEIQREHAERPGVLRSVIHVNNVTMDEKEAQYECLAVNSDVTEPLTASVVVDIAGVRIGGRGPRQPLAGLVRSGSARLHSPLISNMKRSVVVPMTTPHFRDPRRILTDESPLKVKINVDNNTYFEEGVPRVVDCVVEGCDPRPIITWQLGTVQLPKNKEIHDGDFTVSSLTLSLGLRDDGKELICTAKNSLVPNSITYNDKINVTVGIAPVCLSSQKQVLGVVMGEVETATCVVRSSPAPTQFVWALAGRTLYTASTMNMSGRHNEYTSTLEWRPSKTDLGTLQCRAINSYGQQKTPCEFEIKKGGPPNAPNCTIKMFQLKNLKMHCKKNYDGGRPQTLHVELRNPDGTLNKKLSETDGEFPLPTLDNGRNLSALVYSCNSRGCSPKSLMKLANAISEGNGAPWLSITISLIVVVFVFVLLWSCLRTLKLENDSENKEIEMQEIPDGVFRREPDCCREEEREPCPACVNHRLPGYLQEFSPLKCNVVTVDQPRPRLENPGNIKTFYV